MDPEWRPITPDDIPAWNALLARAEAVDRTGEHYDEGDLHEELGEQDSDPEDRVALYDGDTMVAFAGMRVRGDGVDKLHVHAEGTVDPDHRNRGLGTAGMRYLVERAHALRAERSPDLPLEFRVVGMPDNQDQVGVFAAVGLEAVNWSASMRVALDDGRDFAPVAFPAGFTVHRHEQRWSAPMLAAHNAAFQDHWGFVDWTGAMWRQWVEESRNFRPALSWVVVDDDRPDVVVAYVQSNEYEANEAATGRREAYLAKIGVRREYRGRGLASTILRHALHHYQAAGYDESALDVDTNNPTGAFGLYERAGYEIDVRTATYQRLFAPAERVEAAG